MSWWPCSILVALSVVSWTAQLGHLKARKGYKQSYTLVYLALNIFSAAEQTNQSHWLYEEVAKKSQSQGDGFARKSLEWKTLSQMITVWMIFSFFTSVSFSPPSFQQKNWLSIICGLYRLYIGIPLLCGNSRRTVAERVTADFPPLLLYASPVFIYAGLILFKKRPPTRPEPPSFLSIAGLASQIAVHGMLTVAWGLMVRPQLSQLNQPWVVLFMMWNFFWWPMPENAILAGLQGRLLWITLKKTRMVSSVKGQHNIEYEDEEIDSIPDNL